MVREQFGLSVRIGYRDVINKIKKHRPHLNSNSTVVERALDYYLDEIVRLDKDFGGKDIKFNVKKE